MAGQTELRGFCLRRSKRKLIYSVIMQQDRGQIENSFIPYEGEFTLAAGVYDSRCDWCHLFLLQALRQITLTCMCKYTDVWLA